MKTIITRIGHLLAMSLPGFKLGLQSYLFPDF